jgi:hypothetical protein
MQQLTDIVAEYVRQKYATGTGWYSWSFKPEEVPAGVSGIDAPEADWYSRNVALKQGLHARWRAQPAHRADLEKYYVVDWGGVRSNKPETLAVYHGSDARANIARGDKGIASWSKALCVRDPLEFAIFDARVSASLNALQVIHRGRIGAPLRFPLLASRKLAVVRGTALLRRHFQQHAWPRVDQGFYDAYLRLCKAVGERIGSPSAPMPVYAVEMALFAHTEELLRDAFPEAV